jgi:hypothetical protein
MSSTEKICRLDEVREALSNPSLVWEGRLRGLNVLFDLATFYGECLRARFPKAIWLDSAALRDHPRIGGLPRHQVWMPDLVFWAHRKIGEHELNNHLIQYANPIPNRR